MTDYESMKPQNLPWEGNNESTYKELIDNFFKGGKKDSDNVQGDK